MSLTKCSPRARSKGNAGYHHGDLQAALLTEAKRLVNKHGVENISLRQVAANVGVSPSAAYHHFPDKESLLRAASKSAFDDMALFQSQALEKVSGNSALAARKRFRALGESYIGFAQENPNLFRLAFGPYCDGHDRDRESSLPWKMLVASLDELDHFGEIHPAMRPLAEILTWSGIHGATTLLLDEMLPEEAIEPIITSMEMALKSPGKLVK